MSTPVELWLKGTYFKHEYGKTVSSHSGTPGIELTLGGQMVFLDYEQCRLVAKVIDRLPGTSSQTVLLVFKGGDE